MCDVGNICVCVCVNFDAAIEYICWRCWRQLDETERKRVSKNDQCESETYSAHMPTCEVSGGGGDCARGLSGQVRKTVV